MAHSYIEIIARKFPNVQAHTTGGPKDYAALVWEGGDPLPTLEQLEQGHLEIAKEDKIAEINKFRDELAFNYFPYDGKRWDCDDTARLNITGVNVLVMINGGTLPPDMLWRDYDNQDWPVTGSYMVNMGLSMFNFISTVYQVGWYHKSQVQALTTPDEAMMYDFSGGWPSPDPTPPTP